MKKSMNKPTPNSKRRENLEPKSGSTFSSPEFGVTSKRPKVYLKTFGCQMNNRDSEALAGLLQDKGFALTEDVSKADVILFNTCSVRQHAEEKAWSELGRLKPPKFRKNSQNAKLNLNKPKPIIGVIGCMAQNYKEEIFKKMAHVDMVVGPNDLVSIPLLIEAIQKEKSHALAVSTMERQQNFYVSNFRAERNHAYVVISEGCSNFCSYCVVPFVRGRIHCRPHQEILDEIKRTIKSGIKDITLLGQNVNDYLDNHQLEDLSSKNIDFISLLKMVNEIDGLESFDFVTSHPKNISKELFIAMGELDKLKKQLHLPIQSGSDKILKLMNRGYNIKHYKDLLGDYRKIVGGKISTDIIVGFPGESESDFHDTYDLMHKTQFDSAYIFKYSPRPHTEAENFKDDVPRAEKERRHKILLDLQKKISKGKKCEKAS